MSDKESGKIPDKTLRAIRDDVRQTIELLEKGCVVSATIRLVELRQALDRTLEESD